MSGTYPPGPRDGLFGITFHGPLQADPMDFVTRVARDHGDFAFVRVGWVRLYLVNRPELIREVLATKVKSFRKLGKRMLKLDFKGYSKAKQWCEIGEGDEDWPEVLKACADVGYAGWATAEVRGGPKARLEDISARMDKILELK